MVSPGASLLALQMAFFWLCHQMIFVLCRSIPGTSSSSSSKDTSQVGLESTLVTSFDLFFFTSFRCFPGDSDDKESACNAGDAGDMNLIPGLEDPLE